jgi:hypothetical protein
LPRILRVAVVAICALVPSRALATPRPLPFTYTTDTLDQGAAEIEQYADLTTVRVNAPPSGLPAWYAATQFQTEFEYGITDRLELGLYFTLVPAGNNGLENVPVMTEGTGLKQRLRYTFAPPGEWPLDVGVYGELVENDHEFEFEGKVLLQRRFGNLRVDSNLWAEYELYYVPQRDIVLNPTLAATYQLTPSMHVGAGRSGRLRGTDVPRIARASLVVERGLRARIPDRSHDAARRAVRPVVGSHRGGLRALTAARREGGASEVEKMRARA